jgi:N-acetyl sugar amidotransferase
MKYCKKCLYPDTKPDLIFDEEGICSACRSFERRKGIDWARRWDELKQILGGSRQSPHNYDCIIPGSGGKDSTFQAIFVRNMGFNPLIVTATTDFPSELGKKNIENLKENGFDYIEYTPNLIIRRKIARIALNEVGDLSWPEHASIFCIPVRLAIQMGIKTVIFGESPQNEYGGPEGTGENLYLTHRWREEFGGLLGLRVSDFIGREGIRAADLIPYQYPPEDQVSRSEVKVIFLGQFIEWDGWANSVFSMAHGLTTFSGMIEGSLADYENLDNYITGPRDYFKFLKYGFGRATDIACNHIRRGRLQKELAFQLVRKRERFPWSYLGKPLAEILKPFDINIDQYISVCNRFTNTKIFQTDAKGKLIKDKDGTPCPWPSE